MATLTGYQQDRVGTYIEKDPYAVLDYTLDWTNWMPDGETISSISVTVETISGDASPLTLDSSTNTDYLATAFLSAGTAGNIYNVEYRITTSGSKQDSRNLRIKVVERQI
jgi:hypothetical protein